MSNVSTLTTATAETTEAPAVKRGPGRPRLYSDNERVQRARRATRRSQAKRQNQTHADLDTIQTLLSGINISRLNAEGKASVEKAEALIEALLEKFPQVVVEAEAE